MGKNLGSGDKPGVLVVDDSRVMRKAIERALENEYVLIEAGDGEAGWETLGRNNNIDAVITDIQMPLLDGYGLICRIRAADDPHVHDIPIIVITGAEDEVTKERAYACGANDFIVKPINAGQLLSCLRAHTGTAVEPGAEYATTAEHNVDLLTQTISRSKFLEVGNAAFKQAVDHDELLSLVRLDVDNFDALRREHGDDISDQILVWVSNILLARLRREDRIGRLGKYQFAVLTTSQGRVEAAVLCDRLRRSVAAKPFRHEEQFINITVSVGLATAGHDEVGSVDELFDLANQRVMLAQNRGGNSLVAGDNEQVGAIEETVIEEPDIDTALKILAGQKSGSFEPYALDLALRIIPLLEYCDEKFNLGIDREIAALKARLAGVQ